MVRNIISFIKTRDKRHWLRIWWRYKTCKQSCPQCRNYLPWFPDGEDGKIYCAWCGERLEQ